MNPLAEVSASAPQACDVCRGDRSIHVVRQLDGLNLDWRCPHCSLRRPIPIYVYPPYQGDLPNEVA